MACACVTGSRLGPLKMVATAKKPDTITDTAQEFWTRPRTTNANWGYVCVLYVLCVCVCVCVCVCAYTAVCACIQVYAKTACRTCGGE